MNKQQTKSTLTKAERKALNQILSSNKGWVNLPVKPSVQMRAAKVRTRKPRQGASTVLVRAPVAVGRQNRAGNPGITQNGSNIRVRHTEYVDSIVIANPTNFSVLKTYSINPANALLFGWLSTIASRYESYLFRKITLRWVPSCSSLSVGTVGLVVDYNPKDAPPLTKQDCYQNESFVSATLWSGVTTNLIPRDFQKRKSYFCNNTNVLGDASLNDLDTDYSVGNLFLVGECNGGSNGSGDLFVDYDVDLMTPEKGSVLPPSFDIEKGAGGTAANPFGTTPPIVQTTTGPIVASFNQASKIITFLKNYDSLVDLTVAGTGITSLDLNGMFNGLPGLTQVSPPTVNATGTFASYDAIINAIAGDTIDLAQISATGASAITATGFRMAPWGL